MAGHVLYQNVDAAKASDVVKEKAEALDAKLAEYNENRAAVTESLTIADEVKPKRQYKSSK